MLVARIRHNPGPLLQRRVRVGMACENVIHAVAVKWLKTSTQMTSYRGLPCDFIVVFFYPLNFFFLPFQSSIHTCTYPLTYQTHTHTHTHNTEHVSYGLLLTKDKLQFPQKDDLLSIQYTVLMFFVCSNKFMLNLCQYHIFIR